MAPEDGIGSFLVGQLRQSVVRYHSQLKVTIMDKDGPHGSCGRKVCRLLTSVIGWQPCVETLPQVAEQCFGRLRHEGKWICQVLLLHDNGRLHSILAPSDCALFNKMKEPLLGRKFRTSDDLERGVHDSVRSIPKDWYLTSIQKLPERWQQCTDLGGEYVKSATV
ncbi:hypothetical protein Cfor_11318 [Coptotermes formosanus]|uniref:Uncharacterized protein n=1 Tax=Coptotermes formosanus TaxID=36987 RepID=A0A6L2P7W5_COPFO|nr:hypothetical protein Cfor_11318 [Coptotermes formosanus]